MTPTKRTNEQPDEQLELTEDDIRWVRQQRKQDAHEEWLRGQVRILWPWVISVVGALVAAVVWIRDHVKL